MSRQAERHEGTRPGADLDAAALIGNDRAPAQEADRANGRSDVAGGTRGLFDGDLRRAPPAEARSGWPFT